MGSNPTLSASLRPPTPRYGGLRLSAEASREGGHVKSLFFLLALILISCSDSPPPPLQTVEGPEDATVLERTRGQVLLDGPNKDLISISLPTLEQRVVKHREGAPYIYALAGPDSNGRIAYVEDHFFTEDKETKKHLLKVMSLVNRTDEILFERAGAAMFNDFIERDISLSPSGGMIAFVSNYKFVDATPEKWKRTVGGFWQGTLEIWSVEKRAPITTNIQAIANRGTDWLPDGKRLIYTTLLPVTKHFELQGKTYESQDILGWQQIPTTMILDLETGRSHFLCAGWSPRVSSDGRSVLTANLIGRYTLTDIASKKSSPIEWPGNWMGPIALIGDDLVLYWGVPTKGASQKLTENNSPLVGPKRMGTLKIANFKTGKFVTVMNDIDPRWDISYGQVNTP